MNVTLKEIAARAGVSIRTVTRALKDEPGGSPRTYSKVRRIAESLGYTPNIAARNLRNQQTNIAGLVVPFTDCPVTARKIRSAQRCLEANGIYPVTGILPEKPEEMLSMLKNWGGIVNSVIFFSWNHLWNPAEVLKQLTVPFLFVDCCENSSFPRILIDRPKGICEGVSRLIELGYKKIAFLSTESMSGREEGYRRAFDNAEREVDEDLLFFLTGGDFESGYASGSMLMDSGADAVFTATDKLAFGLLKYAYKNNLRIPEDIAVVGFDDEPAGLNSCPALSSIAHPIERMSEEIAAFVKNGKLKSNKLLLPTEFIQRESI